MFGYVPVSLSFLFDTKNGYTPSKSDKSYWENGNVPWFKVEDINSGGRVLRDAKQHITIAGLKNGKAFARNSIIISTSATIGEYALIENEFMCNQRFTCLTVKSDMKEIVDMRYLLYYCSKLSLFCKEHLNQGNFASVDMTKFSKFEFLLPIVKKQKEIVSSLERFDSYCNDIQQGLPAEIEARQKQYEYYRDKLLKFKKLEE